MQRIPFSKMHGLGNSYIYINGFEVQLPEESLSRIAIRMANVNRGIGSDGMILILPSKQADIRMRIFNADGSEAKNCGNGLRCVAKYAYEKGLTRKTAMTIETLGGIVEAKLHLSEEHTASPVTSVTVDMGAPRLRRRDLPMTGTPDARAIGETIEIDGNRYTFTAVSMGNPHAVHFVRDIRQVNVAEIGSKWEHHPMFPERVNVEFVQVLNPTEVIFRVWERGSGITQACGTGACAAVVAGVLNGFLTRGESVTVHLLGGDLEITWTEEGNVKMTGPAEMIAEGEFFY